MDAKGKWAAPVVAFALLIAVLGSAYVGGYFWLSTRHGTELGDGSPVVLRSYKYDWLGDIYRPMSRIEASATGGYVFVVSKDPTFRP